MKGHDWLRSLGSTRDALFVVDHRQRIIFWNAGASGLFGYSEEEVLGKPCYQVIGGRRGERLWCQPNCGVQLCVRRGVYPSHSHLESRTKEGRPIWVSVSFIRLEERGEPMTVHLVQDVSRQQRMREAMTDVLSALRAHGILHSAPAATRITAPAKASGRREAGRVSNLTRREIEALKFVAAGLSTDAIAERMGISHFTARNHIQNALRKIGLHSRAQAVSFVFSRRLL